MLEQKFTLPFPPLQVRAGLVVADGYGINVHVRYGKLHIEDGIADRRRSLVLDRAGSGVERVVLLGKTGTLTLEALAWLRAIGAALVHLGPDGALLTHSVPYGYDGQPIRRAQALAIGTGLDVELARGLISKKLEGQRSNLVRIGNRDLGTFDAMKERLNLTMSIDEVRLVEAKAAALYWNAWSSVGIRFSARDLARIPARWARYDSRASILTGAPRAATNPVNALLNYLYALLEAESRLALLAAGLDPTLGVLHADQRNRDSFALDAMEPVRPDVDAFVLDLIEAHDFTSRHFVEMPNGVCRVRAPLTHDLALTLPRWRSLVAPIAAHLAQTFRTPPQQSRSRTEGPRTRTTSTTVERRSAAQSPLTRTPRKSPAARPYASKAWNPPRPESVPLIPASCTSCGQPVQKRRRRYCDRCLPKARSEHVERAIAKARKALATQALQGPDPRTTPSANAARGKANSEHHRHNREWTRSNEPRSDAWFLSEITPKLDRLSLAQIAQATGLSLAACSRFRAGKRIPHPRHWAAFESLVLYKLSRRN